ncbi:MAG: histidine kinase [Gammaproteobacteria bacterium]|nr:histidine kinase [Gammaproteobacteria bacterium]OUT95845.1 MAG: hypothetical protein CBB96_03045 [Gammaproteobacteria bacterium TMED36]|tara:strand:+ start:29550 stop:31421 length:1872 start_codon:yes stop_codon:yes gene_type:complete
MIKESVSTTSENNQKYISADLFQEKSLSELQKLSAKELFDLGKLRYPVYKSSHDESYSVITYQDAIKIIASRIKASDPSKSFYYASGRSSNEATFLLDLFARTIGCKHIITCSNYCHEASGIALSNSLGLDNKSISYDDLKHSDLIFVIGANPTSNHPKFAEILRNHKENGNNIIAVNPSIESELYKLTTHYCQPNIGGDVALFTGISKCLIENGHSDMDSIKENTVGFDQFKQFIDNISWESIETNSGIERNEIMLICDQYASSKRTVFTWGMGLTHHVNGTDNIESIINLAILRSMVNGKGRGLLPLRWHDNAPQLPFMGFKQSTKKRIFESFENTYGINLPTNKGKDTLTCMQTAHMKGIDFAFLLGGNLFSVNPDRNFSESALNNIPFKVMVSSTLNETHLFGVNNENLILPIRDHYQSESLFDLKTEVQILSEVATKSLERDDLNFEDFAEHSDIMDAIKELLPDFDMNSEIRADNGSSQGIDDERIGNYSYKLRTPNQSSWDKESTPNTFKLSSVRSEGQFNTMIYDDADLFRKQTSRDVLYINAEDIRKLGLSNGSLVDVESETGSMKKLTLAEYDIKPGNVMTYMPEANILIPQDNDVRSKTPSFKSVSVTIVNH